MLYSLSLRGAKGGDHRCEALLVINAEAEPVPYTCEEEIRLSELAVAVDKYFVIFLFKVAVIPKDIVNGCARRIDDLLGERSVYRVELLKEGRLIRV